MQSMDWDIFRFVVAVVESGSAVAAAKVLGVDGTTVLRRITKFEEERGIQLFDRLPSGYSPTLECEAIVKLARDLQEGVSEIDRRITGHDLRLEGTIAVTTTDSFLDAVMADIISEFCTLHPQIRIETMVTTNRLNLSRQDAHVAVRASLSPPENLICQRVSGVAFAVYGNKEFVAASPEKPELQDLLHMPWIGLGSTLSRSPADQWIGEHVPLSQIKTTADTFVAMRSLARSGTGLATLPCCLGDPEPALERVLPVVNEMGTSLWVLTHPDVRKAAKVRAFTAHVGRQLRAQQQLLEGSAA
ncbi:MAG: LysR family transcriptional regulator [Rhizobiaceae bacterium]|nr:LysR family transcriptional regulator [Rhizobiaceae bacterium]